MPYDPAKPAAGSPNSSAEMRAQLQGLHALIPSSASVGSIATGPPGSLATATVTLSSGSLQFDFTIPEGQPGAPGEVTQAQLSNDLVNCQNAAVNTTLPLTSANSNGVATLSGTISDPPTQAEVTAQQDKINELILALRR